MNRVGNLIEMDTGLGKVYLVADKVHHASVRWEQEWEGEGAEEVVVTKERFWVEVGTSACVFREEVDSVESGEQQIMDYIVDWTL